MAFMRPSPLLAQYATPVDGLYLCGAGTHPGGGVMAACGHNAAMRVLKDRRGGLRGRLRLAPLSSAITSFECVIGRRLPSSSIREPLALVDQLEHAHVHALVHLHLDALARHAEDERFAWRRSPEKP